MFSFEYSRKKNALQEGEKKKILNKIQRRSEKWIRKYSFLDLFGILIKCPLKNDKMQLFRIT